jgi:hypothetical protein
MSFGGQDYKYQALSGVTQQSSLDGTSVIQHSALESAEERYKLHHSFCSVGSPDRAAAWEKRKAWEMVTLTDPDPQKCPAKYWFPSLLVLKMMSASLSGYAP